MFYEGDSKVFCWGWNKYGQVAIGVSLVCQVQLFGIIQVFTSYWTNEFIHLCAAWTGWCDRSKYSIPSLNGWSCTDNCCLWMVAHTSTSWITYLNYYSSYRCKFTSFARLGTFGSQFKIWYVHMVHIVVCLHIYIYIHTLAWS